MKNLGAILFAICVCSLIILGADQAALGNPPEPVCYNCNCSNPTGYCNCWFDCGGTWVPKPMTCVYWCAEGCGYSPC
jgi:hypothetical protein